MKNYEYQIRDYKKFVQEKCINEKKEEQTIKICQNILTDQTLKKQSSRASYFEFLYEQSKFIKKRWWFLQGAVLLFLWIWLGRCTTDLKDTMRLLGIFATLFVILIVPEIWKNRRNGAIEIEQASYYTLRQICAARTLMFAAADFVIVMIFLVAAYSATSIALSDLIIKFFASGKFFVLYMFSAVI